MNNQLYEIVKAYDDIGIHRTGTDVDRATLDWLAAQLRARAAKVSCQDYRFDFFSANATVILDGQEIASMPLYYEAIGDVTTDHVAVAEFGDGEHGSGLDDSLEMIINDASIRGFEALVIATRGETGALVAINCAPILRNRIPVMLIPGRYASALKAGSVRVEYSATVNPGVSSNITGHWGESLAGPPFVITTPMSGWFTCAGERGTGIAVALQVAEWLSINRPHVPLKLILPSGHELGFYGARKMAQTITTRPMAVLHLGSCIANRDASMRAIVHADAAACEAINTALAPIQILADQPENYLNPDCWVGESQCWAEFGMPMLSVAGISPAFHTADDIARTATTAVLLKHTVRCMTRAAVALIEACDSN